MDVDHQPGRKEQDGRRRPILGVLLAYRLVLGFHAKSTYETQNFVK